MSHGCSVVSFSNPQWLPCFTCVFSIPPQTHSQSCLLISSHSLQFFTVAPRRKQSKQKKRKANCQTGSTLPAGYSKLANLRKDTRTHFTNLFLSTLHFRNSSCTFPFLSMGKKKTVLRVWLHYSLSKDANNPTTELSPPFFYCRGSKQIQHRHLHYRHLSCRHLHLAECHAKPD